MLVKFEMKILEQLMKGGTLLDALSGAPSQNSGVRLKPPTFNGQLDPKHFFVKLFNYLETYKVKSEEEKIRVLKSCLEGPALDLYLALPKEEQGDIMMLEKTESF